MEIHFGYNKKQVLDGLRSHFIGRREIRILFIVVNLFAILSAVLYYFNKIQALSFLIFSLLWFILYIVIRKILPLSIYKRSQTFRDTFTMNLEEDKVKLQTDRGLQVWHWQDFSSFRETLFFFHLYFDSRSFFLVPKDSFRDLVEIQEARNLIRSKISNKGL
ncbi:MAG TPA: YcxB family protein [Flavitalea sp.]|nr:YcxB family protein [Flavitalea sp.]